MPKKLEEKLKREAERRGYGEERTNAYVYGTLRKTGWKPKKKKSARAEATRRLLEKK